MDEGGIHLVALRKDVDVADQILRSWPPLTVNFCGYLYVSDHQALPPDFALKLAFVIDRYKAPVAFDCTRRPMVIMKRGFLDMTHPNAPANLRNGLQGRTTWRRSLFRYKNVEVAPGQYTLQDFINAVTRQAKAIGLEIMTLDF